MAAQLTATGVIFSDGTSITSKYSVLDQNTVGVFYQAAAPTGWTQVTAHNDKALRLVNGAGGGFGFGTSPGSGGSNFSTVFPSSNSSVSLSFTATAPVSGTVGGHTLTTSEIPDHTHDSGLGGTANASSGSSSFRTPGSNQTGGVNSAGGISQSHDHPFSGTVTLNATGTGNIDMRIQYIDVIICSFA